MAQKDDNLVEEPADAGDSKQPAGKVEFDNRGKAVWRWARELVDSTSILLKRLENHDLALEPTQKVPIARSAAEPGKAPRWSNRPDPSLSDSVEPDSGGGFDPYNSRR